MPAEGTDLAPAPEGAFAHRGVGVGLAPVQGAEGSHWGIVVARFNGEITNALFHGAVDALCEAGVRAEHVHAVSVPGAVELPLAAKLLADSKHGIAGIVALGCVIRGETAHFDYVCRAATDGIVRVQLECDVPIGFGLLTVDHLEQAKARAEPHDGGHNAGRDAARAALELATIAASV